MLEQKQDEPFNGLSGFTDNYLRVNLPNATIDMVNTFQDVLIEGFDVTGDLKGKLISFELPALV
ncbi:MAG: hypothetical protein IPN15_17950 [Saprospiraceae bacterium]|nr:hypothetical protein [Candidatus Vicinibacter affinis]